MEQTPILRAATGKRTEMDRPLYQRSSPVYRQRYRGVEGDFSLRKRRSVLVEKAQLERLNCRLTTPCAGCPCLRGKAFHATLAPV